VLWHYATGITDPSLGSDSSLAVLNHVVYFVVRGRVFAFGDRTGKVLWHQDVLPASAHVWGSNTYSFALDGDVLLVRLENNGGSTSVLFALRATTGSILWHYEMNADYLMIASHGIVYIGTRDANGSNPMLRALRSADGKELWSYNTGQRYITDPETALVVGDVLYLQSGVFGEPVIKNTGFFQSLTALNAITGKVLWSKPLHTNVIAGSQNNQGLLLWANNQVILYSGYHFCAYSSRDGSQLWCSHDFGQRPPQVSSNTIIETSIPDFYAVAGQTLATIGISFGNTFHLKVETLSLKTGKMLWTRTPALLRASGGVGVGQIGALIRGDSSSVYAVIGDDTYAFNTSNGQILWHTRSGAAGITGLAVG
jgi:outer membrane protein assembly factor BamB